jgi:tetratricopeptide (TPR) repeat protein
MIELRPKEPWAYFSLARMFAKQGRAGKAAECFDLLVRAAPDSEEAYRFRARFRRDRGEYDEALADCDRAEKAKPGWALAALVRASIAAARGQPAAAVAAAQQTLETAPKGDGNVLYAAASVWSLAARTAGPGEAERYAERAADLIVAALDKGLHDMDYSELNGLADDPALAPIREIPRVRDLLAHKPK